MAQHYIDLGFGITEEKLRSLPRGTVITHPAEMDSVAVILRFIGDDHVKVAWIPHNARGRISIYEERIVVMIKSKILDVQVDMKRLEMLDILYDELEEL